LFALFYVAAEVMVREDEARERVLAALLLGGLALTALCVAQYHWLGFDRLDRRPHGFLGHYMSAAGVTTVVLLLAAARLVSGPRPRARLRDFWLVALVLLGVAAVAAARASHQLLETRLFVAGLAVLTGTVALCSSPRFRAAEAVLPMAVLPVATWALVVSQTRSAWVGVCCGLVALAVLRSPRLLAAVAVAVVALLVVRPGPLRERLTITDASSVDRYYMWQAGIDMLADHPVFGVGPGMVLTAYPQYRWPEAPNLNAPHLHNNVVQIAAERGVPGLVFFVWWTGAVLLTALREARRTDSGSASRQASGAVLAVLTAVFAAGLFEYNLGDSEVLLLVLLMTAIPFALARGRAASA